MRASLAVLITLLLSTAAPAHDDREHVVQYDFNDSNLQLPCAVEVTGQAARRNGGPQYQRGQLALLAAWMNSSASAAFRATTNQPHRVIELSWTLTMNTGTEGAGVAWLNTEQHGTDGAAPQFDQWQAPSLPGAFGIGFDAKNPVNRDWFSGSGNIYDRPQHELSLHWDGMEIVKRTTPMDFRDERPHAVQCRIVFTPGGAEVSVWIDDVAIYENHFIATMTPYIGRPAFGATNRQTAGDTLIDNLVVRCIEPIAPPPPPVTVVMLDKANNDAIHHTNEAQVQFPENTDQYARIICTLQLSQPGDKPYDPWDRLAHIYVVDDHGEKIELLRYITPYHKGHTWSVDVTDFRPLLRGERTLIQHCVTYGSGWAVSVRFDFHTGRTDRYAERLVTLWSGRAVIGNPDRPVEDFYVPRTVVLNDQPDYAKVRIVVTGHGMSPNTGNAAEFMPINRTLTVNRESFENLLWKTDNYLNPCRPQGGTWKFDRAGWAPGDVVAPWEVDVSHLLAERSELEIRYTLEPYLNENHANGSPNHQTAAYLVLYRAVPSPPTRPAIPAP